MFTFRGGHGATYWTTICVVGALTCGLPKALAAEAVVIAVFGDSLVAGFGVAPGDAFPVRLEAALTAQGIDADVVNAGVSGDTSAGGLARIDWAVADGTDLVIVELGANDGLRGLDPEVTRANLDAILTRLAERGIPVVLAGMLAPPNLGRDYGDRFNAIFPQLADRHDVVLIPFFLEGVATVRELNQSDGLHPNATGVEIVVETVLPFVLEALEP